MKTMSYQTITKTLNGDSVTPISIFRKLVSERKFLLESAQNSYIRDPYSYIGAGPVKTIIEKNQQLVEINHVTNETTIHAGNMFANLKKLMPDFESEGPYAFMGGAIGYANFQALNQLSEKLEGKTSNIQLDLYDTVIVFDHVTDEINVVHTDFMRSYEEAQVEALIQTIFETTEQEDSSYALAAFEETINNRQYSEMIQKAKTAIQCGEVAQLVISKRLEAQMEGDAFALYRSLRKKTPAPYMYYFQYPDHVLMGVSPESIVKIKGSQVLITPITGARPRGQTAREDISIELSLLQNSKEVNTHNLLVDQTSQELEKICIPSSVQLVEYMKPKQFKHSIRLTTTIEGILIPSLHPFDVLIHLLPPASSSGVPKLQAARVVHDIEPVDRSFYGGALGYFSFNGNINFTLLQQSMLIRDGKATIQAGANVLSDTLEEDALLETYKKIKAFRLMEHTKS